MRRLGPLPLILVSLGLGFLASYLAVGAWWQGPDDNGSTTGDQDAREDSAPGLAHRAPRAQAEVVDTAEAEALLAALQGKDPKEQRRVFERRAHRPRVPYYEPLARHLIELLRQDERGALWYYGFAYLVGMGQPVAALFDPHVDSKDAVLRRMAIAVLVALRIEGVEVSLPPLLTLLEDPDTYVRERAWSLLYQGVPYDEAIAKRMLGHMQRDPKPRHWSAGKALAQMGPQGIALLLGELKVSDARRRVAALGSIAHAPVEELRRVLGHLAEAMQDPVPSVREAALRALARLDGDCVECLPALLETMQEDHIGIVQASLHVLEEMGPAAEEAVPLLLERLRDDDPRLVSRAAGVLGAIHARPAKVLPALAALVREDASDAAAAAIGAFGRAGLDHAVALLHDEDDDVRYTALMAFQAMGEGAARIVPELLPLIRGDDHTMALRAVETAGAIGPTASAAIPAILERLSWGHEDLPADTAGPALVRMGSAVEEPLRKALRSKDYTTRKQAVRVVGWFHGRSQFAFDELEALFEDEDAFLREQAMSAARMALEPPQSFGDEAEVRIDAGVLERLRAMFERASKDENESVRRLAEAYLGGLDLVDRER